jgi:uncharacterized repeat protein (TIGR03803 family)
MIFGKDNTFLGGNDGDFPSAGLIFDLQRALYGTTNGGYGTVFKLTPTATPPWTKTILYSFTGGNDGANPLGSLIANQQGRLFGTTYVGGTSNKGTVFKLKPPGPARSRGRKPSCTASRAARMATVPDPE